MPVLHLKNREITSKLPAFVMGIVNATPDSFYKGSRGGIERALELVESGADILDIGGESTRPGFTEISVEEELNRVIPLIKEIRKNSDVVISVDTRKSEVAKQGYDNGADIINDVSCFKSDSNMLDVIEELKLPVVVMHGWGLSEDNCFGKDKIVKVVKNFFEEKVSLLINHGISSEKIILDPGIGFGKSFEENVELIKHTDLLKYQNSLFLMALSRKRCIGQITGTEIEGRMVGTVSADLISVIKGAQIVRVHDVKETIESLKIMKYLF